MIPSIAYMYGENQWIKLICSMIVFTLISNALFIQRTIFINPIAGITGIFIIAVGFFLIAPTFAKTASETGRNPTVAFVIGALGMFGLFIPTILYWVYMKSSFNKVQTIRSVTL